MKLIEIQDLIKFVAKSGVSEVHLETKEVKITIKTPTKRKSTLISASTNLQQSQQLQMNPQQMAQNTSAMQQADSITPQKATSSGEENFITIKSPMIGTFYRSAGPDKGSFVNVGDEISVGNVVCIIEAMKLFNEIESEIKGRIVKVLVGDATPVEYDQPLFLVEPV